MAPPVFPVAPVRGCAFEGMMMRICTFLILLWLMPVNPAIAGSEGKSYTRVVSLDYCADQFMLKLLSKPQILAVSKGTMR